MNKRPYFFASALLTSGLAPFAAIAQTADTVTITHVVEPHLVTAAVAGLIFALAFQLLFTLISLTGGFSLLPNVMKLSAKHKADRLAAGNPLHPHEEAEHGLPEHHAAMSLTVVNELGVWVLGTTSIALFLATWLSMRLSFLGTDEYRYVLALSVWAVYIIFVTYLEWKSVKTLAGGLFGIAVAGLGAGKEVLSGLLHKSPEARLEDFGKQTFGHIYRDLAQAAQKGDVDKKVSRYLSNVKSQGIDYDLIHDEVAGFLKQAKSETGFDANVEDLIGKISKRLEKPHHIFTPTNAVLLYAAVRRASQTAKSANRTSDGLFGYIDAFVPLPDEQIKAMRQKVEELLAKTHREELDPEAIRRDIESIIDNPGDSMNVIRGRLAHFDRETLKSLVRQSGIIDSDRVDRIMASAQAAVTSINEKYKMGLDQVMQAKGKLGEAAQQAGEKFQTASDTLRQLPAKFEDKIHAYIDSMQAPELNYDILKMDLVDMLHDPMEAPHILRDRLKTFDAATLESVLQANPWIPAAQIKSVIQQVDHAKTEALKQISSVEDKAIALFEQGRRRAAIAAEHARRAAAAAGWWSVGTAIASAAASLAGAYYSTFSF